MTDCSIDRYVRAKSSRCRFRDNRVHFIRMSVHRPGTDAREVNVLSFERVTALVSYSSRYFARISFENLSGDSMTNGDNNFDVGSILILSEDHIIFLFIFSFFSRKQYDISTTLKVMLD